LRSFKTLNHPNTTCGTAHENYCITDLSSFVERPDITDGPPDETFYLGFNMYAQDAHQIYNESKYMPFMSEFTGYQPGRG
jgi:hypothetical protein